MPINGRKPEVAQVPDNQGLTIFLSSQNKAGILVRNSRQFSATFIVNSGVIYQVKVPLNSHSE